MKKITAIVLTVISLVSVFIIPSFAAADVGYEFENGESVIETVTGLYDAQEVQSLSTGLITSKSLKLTKTTNGLVMTAKTNGTTEVTKCGFTYIKLQRLVNGSWTDYKTYCYTDQYKNSTSMTFSKTVTPTKGYKYRLICEHYAEKKKLLVLKDKETIYNVTSSLSY